MTKNVTILGSTGSIGISTLKVLKFLKDEFSVYGLSCNSNIELLEKQLCEFHPKVVSVESSDIRESLLYKDMKSNYPHIEFIESSNSSVELAGRPVDIFVSAVVGAAGLEPALQAIKVSKRIALANKETLVMAGDLFISKVSEFEAELIPVDSEHSAIFLLINDLSLSDIDRIILTASGGALRNVPVEDFDIVTPEMVLKHPTWDMGKKITVDSATMMNKGLEVIEAHHLFNMGYDKIEVIIHPESVIHSMVETIEGVIYAHMSVPDMTFPILNALKYPKKVRNNFGKLRLEEIGRINFYKYDCNKYPALDLCYNAGKIGGTMPAVLNAANEMAVDAFLNNKILFTDIIKIVEETMGKHKVVSQPELEDIYNADRESREISNSKIGEIQR